MTEKQFERTVEHLVGLHAKAEARMDRLERQLQATADLVRAGIQFVTKIARNQRQTDQKVNRWILALYRASRNGR